MRDQSSSGDGASPQAPKLADSTNNSCAMPTQQLALIGKVKARFARGSGVAWQRELDRKVRERRKAEQAPAKTAARLAYMRAFSARLRAEARAEREAAKAAEPQPLGRPPLSAEVLRAAGVKLVAWFKLGGKRQKLMKSHARRYACAQRVLLRMRHEGGAAPTPASFVARFNAEFGDAVGSLDRMSGRRALTQLAMIEAETGCWLSVTPADEGSARVVTPGDEGSRRGAIAGEEGLRPITHGDEGCLALLSGNDAHAHSREICHQ